MKSHQHQSTTLSNRLSKTLQQQWLSGGWLSSSLKPLAALNAIAQIVRKALYRYNIKKSYRAPCPVIVVGNIFVGGTGKTPVVAALVQELERRGFKLGIISRGYGVKIGKEARVATAKTSAEMIGDEPALLAQYAPIAVHPQRRLAVEALLKAHPETNVIVADDGLQHLALQRDVEIIVQDARGIGNGCLLPAGPLREAASKLQAVDFIINNSARSDDANKLKPQPTHTSSPVHLNMQLRAQSMVHILSGEQIALQDWLSRYQQKTIVAVAGIGNPQRFFDSLREYGIYPEITLAFPDHHPYQASDFEGLTQDIILMTEKDALKCRDFADERFYFLKVEAIFSDQTFFDKIEQLIKI